jgi:hypothetical protein
MRGELIYSALAVPTHTGRHRAEWSCRSRRARGWGMQPLGGLSVMRDFNSNRFLVKLPLVTRLR